MATSPVNLCIPSVRVKNKHLPGSHGLYYMYLILLTKPNSRCSLTIVLSYKPWQLNKAWLFEGKKKSCCIGPYCQKFIVFVTLINQEKKIFSQTFVKAVHLTFSRIPLLIGQVNSFHLPICENVFVCPMKLFPKVSQPYKCGKENKLSLIYFPC